MMPTQSATQIRNLIQVATVYGVELPEDFTAQAAHLAELAVEQRATPTPGKLAVALSTHLGNPVAMRKARAKAAADLAAAEADAKIASYLTERCAALLGQRMRNRREDIAARFAPAVAGPLATLTADAARLPGSFKPEQADTLNADLFAAWTRVRDALAVLDGPLGQALAPLYPQGTDYLEGEATAALRYTEPPEFTDYVHATEFARALAGVRHGGSDLGPLTVQGVLAPAACAGLGATFSWATPIEVAHRVEVVTAASVPPVVERGAAQPRAGRAGVAIR